MPIKEHWGIENAPLWHFLCLLEERIPSNNCKIFLTETLGNMHSIHVPKSQYIVSDTTKHFKFELDRKLNPWSQFEANFLTCLPNGK